MISDEDTDEIEQNLAPIFTWVFKLLPNPLPFIEKIEPPKMLPDLELNDAIDAIPFITKLDVWIELPIPIEPENKTSELIIKNLVPFKFTKMFCGPTLKLNNLQNIVALVAAIILQLSFPILTVNFVASFPKFDPIIVIFVALETFNGVPEYIVGAIVDENW